jgi:hypothetical protein
VTATFATQLRSARAIVLIPLHVCILTSTALALMLAVPHSTFARDLDAGTTPTNETLV